VQAFLMGPEVASGSASDPSVKQRRPSAVRVGDDCYVAWESTSPASAGGSGAQASLSRVAFDASAPDRVRQDPPIHLPYPAGGGWPSHVHLAASPLFPAGALISAWEAASDGTLRATSDVELDFRPSPFVFLARPDAGDGG
jgi:hypothetical protein